jgi:glycosyltransferase involved in cell wall biosynthesis
MAHNYGPYVTFNTMMKFASGDLIARFDADDIMLQNYLLEQIQILDRYKNVQISRTWSVYTDINFSPVSALLANGSYTSPDGKRKSASDGQFTMKKEVWSALGSFKPWRCFADSDFLTRARFLGFNIYEIKNYLYLRRVHSKSLTQKKETAYNSRLRQTYRQIMERDRLSYVTQNDVYISPVIGYIENVR